ncbi:MAG: TIGR04282 family arsenosugar biosynthesis glycosyltransferase [Oscillospiraceae bacterium]|nr:TIGR04282 family arsenosugar biosynthesis glycosyltransferase [Oscillospiraceae bacterium]
MKKAIICFTSVPQAGKTKTRLNTFMSGEDSAALNSAFLRDISAVLEPYDADVFIAYTPEGDHWELRRIFPYATAFFAQKGGDLGERMHNALQYVLDSGYEAAVLTGADLPLLRKENFDSAFEALEEHDVTYGPSGDGGYYLVGIKRPCPQLFGDLPYGKDVLYEAALNRVSELGLSFAPAMNCSDVDTAEDLHALVHALDSDSHTARLMDLLGLGDGPADGGELRSGGNLAENFPFWELLNKSQKSKVKEKCSREILKKGTILFGNSEGRHGLILLRSGAMRMYMMSNEGRELNTFHFGPGDVCFFSASKMIPEIDFECLVEITEDVQALALRAEDFSALMKENKAMELYVYKLFTERYTDIVKFLCRVIFEKLDKRLARFLLEEAERGRGKTVLATHDHVACEIGSAREVVSKTLKQMAKNGLIELSYNRIEILDAEALRKIVLE